MWTEAAVQSCSGERRRGARIGCRKVAADGRGIVDRREDVRRRVAPRGGGLVAEVPIESHQRPLQVGLRFSANAAMPSAASSVSNSR